MIDRTEIEKREYIAAFDGLRAIAIMSIVGHQMMAYRIPGGFLGLNIFLLLSGYFMTASLMDSLMKNGKVPLKSFLTKRLKRIILFIAISKGTLSEFKKYNGFQFILYE